MERKIFRGKVSCQPLGCGFLLGGGAIWYNKFDSEWSIWKIHGAVEEASEVPFSGWIINEKVVHPFCFNVRGYENYEELAELDAHEKLSMAEPLELCSKENFNFENKHDGIYIKDSSDIEYTYKLLRSKTTCVKI